MSTFHELTVFDCGLLLLYTQYISKYAADLKGLTPMQIMSSFIGWYNTDNNCSLPVNLKDLAHLDLQKLINSEGK